jgi:hypothetical protein
LVGRSTIAALLVALWLLDFSMSTHFIITHSFHLFLPSLVSYHINHVNMLKRKINNNLKLPQQWTSWLPCSESKLWVWITDMGALGPMFHVSYLISENYTFSWQSRLAYLTLFIRWLILFLENGCHIPHVF